jgi:twitching motility protein PilT
LSDTVRYVVSQRLVPKLSGGRLLITEVIGSSLRTREAIRYGESEGKTFHEIMDAATLYGWHTFDHCLLKAVEANDITEETALLYCNDKGRVRRELDLLQKRRGEPQVEEKSALKLEPVAAAKLARDAAAQPVEPTQTGAADSAVGGTASKRRIIQPRSQTPSQQAPPSVATQ